MENKTISNFTDFKKTIDFCTTIGTFETKGLKIEKGTIIKPEKEPELIKPESVENVMMLAWRTSLKNGEFTMDVDLDLAEIKGTFKAIKTK